MFTHIQSKCGHQIIIIKPTHTSAVCPFLSTVCWIADFIVSSLALKGWGVNKSDLVRLCCFFPLQTFFCIFLPNSIRRCAYLHSMFSKTAPANCIQKQLGAFIWSWCFDFTFKCLRREAFWQILAWEYGKHHCLALFKHLNPELSYRASDRCLII